MSGAVVLAASTILDGGEQQRGLSASTLGCDDINSGTKILKYLCSAIYVESQKRVRKSVEYRTKSEQGDARDISP